MHLTKEQRQALDDRNKKILNDYLNHIPKDKIMKKYGLKKSSIDKITRGFVRERIEDEPVLTEAEQRLREKYRNFDIANEIGKGISIRSNDVEYIAAPKQPDSQAYLLRQFTYNY